jgi:hypothetical protein
MRRSRGKAPFVCQVRIGRTLLGVKGLRWVVLLEKDREKLTGSGVWLSSSREDQGLRPFLMGGIGPFSESPIVPEGTESRQGGPHARGTGSGDPVTKESMK